MNKLAFSRRILTRSSKAKEVGPALVPIGTCREPIPTSRRDHTKRVDGILSAYHDFVARTVMIDLILNRA